VRRRLRHSRRGVRFGLEMRHRAAWIATDLYCMVVARGGGVLAASSPSTTGGPAAARSDGPGTRVRARDDAFDVGFSRDGRSIAHPRQTGCRGTAVRADGPGGMIALAHSRSRDVSCDAPLSWPDAIAWRQSRPHGPS